MDSTDVWCLKVLEKWSLLHPVNILGHVSVFWPNYPHLISKQTQSQNSRGAGRRNVQKEQEPWEYPRELLVPGRILSLSRLSATAAWGSASPSAWIQVQNADSDSGGLSWGLRVCIPEVAGLHTTPELARLWETRVSPPLGHLQH